jgi:hypothetical protein
MNSSIIFGLFPDALMMDGAEITVGIDEPPEKRRTFKNCQSPLLVRRGGRDIEKISRSVLLWSGRGGGS